MKRLLAISTLIFWFTSSAFALSDSEYLKLKKNNANFSRADKNLTRVWSSLKKELSESDFKQLQQDQRDWIAKGRDDAAEEYISEGYSRAEAYTLATNDRTNALPQIAADIEQGIYYAGKAQDFGEIEEERFEGEGYAGNYSRRDSKGKGGFMTVIITDKSTNEAEITVSVENPETTWSARGWIDDNILELSDENYSKCQATLTFSGDSVKFEASKSQDWQEVLGVDADLSGTYSRNR